MEKQPLCHKYYLKQPRKKTNTNRVSLNSMNYWLSQRSYILDNS